MRKILIVLLAVFGLATAAHAQEFTARFGPQITVVSDFGFSLEASVQGKELSKFTSGLSLGLNGVFSLNFFGGGVGFLISVGPTLNIEFDRAKGDAYFGINLGVAGGDGGRFIFAFVMGAHYFVTPTVNLFSNLYIIVVRGTGGIFDLGADFRLSRGLAIYGKLVVGFGGSFGLGGGLTIVF
jgi:hypothetical protein